VLTLRSKISLILIVLTLFQTGVSSHMIISVDSIERANLSCNCIAFRLDDVQDYFTREAQMDLIKMFHDENLTLTLGVIGGFLNEDTELLRFLQSSNNGLIEFANHGWNHTDHSLMTLEEQRASIQMTNEHIQEIFGTNVKTFIPPQNSFDDDTLSVLRDLTVTHISSSIFTADDNPPYPLKDGDSILHFSSDSICE
jgi:peptidoglycan/xylan/chitin deacetylase (PgdA/CDA1 family)